MRILGDIRPWTIVVFLALLLAGLAAPQRSFAANDWRRFSAQTIALTPNAGGQQAFALRYLKGNREWSVFANDYLRAGPAPLVGGGYSWRFDLVSIGWPIQPYIQLGVGASSAGPYGEITWGTNLFWLARIDFSTQMFTTLDRLVAWSYPLWLGISFPF